MALCLDIARAATGSIAAFWSAMRDPWPASSCWLKPEGCSRNLAGEHRGAQELVEQGKIGSRNQSPTHGKAQDPEAISPVVGRAVPMSRGPASTRLGAGQSLRSSWSHGRMSQAEGVSAGNQPAFSSHVQLSAPLGAVVRPPSSIDSGSESDTLQNSPRSRSVDVDASRVDEPAHGPRKTIVRHLAVTERRQLRRFQNGLCNSEESFLDNRPGPE